MRGVQGADGSTAAPSGACDALGHPGLHPFVDGCFTCLAEFMLISKLQDMALVLSQQNRRPCMIVDLQP